MSSIYGPCSASPRCAPSNGLIWPGVASNWHRSPDKRQSEKWGQKNESNLGRQSFRVQNSLFKYQILLYLRPQHLMKSIQSISVFGLGKLGACIAATFAARGFPVLGVDVDPAKIQKINAGLPPVEEPLLAQTVTAGHARLRATDDARQAAATDVSFFIPPSPSLPDGSFSNEFLLRAMQPVAAAVREQGEKGHLFVCRSE